MSKYVDYKATIWGRLHFSDETDMNKVIAKLEQGLTPNELCDDPELEFEEFEMLFDSEEYITPSENQGQCTVEVYDDISNPNPWQERIWDNVNKRKQD